MRIGFFDSGLGGLLVLKAVTELLPEYDYCYYGDTANLPYGDKSESEIYELTKKGVEYLFTQECQLVVLACNTASSETLRRLQDEFLPAHYPKRPACRDERGAGRRILGVIIPVIEEVISSDIRRALLIGTKRTVSSGKYHLELGKRDITDTKIQALATPGLVPLIEKNMIDDAFTLAKNEIDPEVGEPVCASHADRVDGLILGCTHYIVLKELLRTQYAEQLIVFSQDEIIPRKLKKYLEAHPEIEQTISRNGQRNIHLTKTGEHYDELAAQFLQGHLIGGV